MSDEKKRTRDALLGELESIKDLLNEEEADDAEPPLLTTPLDEEASQSEDDPPLLTEALNSVIDEIRDSASQDNASQNNHDDEEHDEWDHLWEEIDNADDDADAVPVLNNPADADDAARDALEAEATPADNPPESVPKTVPENKPSPDDTAETETLETDLTDDDDDLLSRALRARQTPPPGKPEPAAQPDDDQGEHEPEESEGLAAESLEPDTQAEPATGDDDPAADSERGNKAEHQPSLFDPPAPKPAPAKPATANNRGYTPPKVNKAENPFLPKHIRDRLHGNRSLQQQIASGEAPVKTAPASNAEDQLVERVMQTVMPKIEQELRDKIRQILQEERQGQSTQDPAPQGQAPKD